MLNGSVADVTGTGTMSASTMLGQGPRIADFLAPIASELAEAERIFAQELGSRHPFVQQLVDHCSAFRGKRLRPALVLLCGQAVGRLTPDHPVLAAVVEMIHTATLVHDDILDESLVRRHAATINAEWGNETAVLLGDYLFTHAFHLAASLESTLACRWIGRATNLVCEGEMNQVHHRGDLDLDESTYLDIIQGKTAELIAVSCKLGAHYAGADVETTERLERFGRDLGSAFQIADDVLDLWGEERVAGKSLGTDLFKQKLTLPVIRLLNVAPLEVRREVHGLLNQPGPETRRRLRDHLNAYETLDYSWTIAGRFVESSLEALAILPPSQARTLLEAMARSVLRRDR